MLFFETRLSWGLPVTFIDSENNEREGYYAPRSNGSDWIVTIGEDGKGTYPHYRADSIKWRLKYGAPHERVWSIPESNNQQGVA